MTKQFFFLLSTIWIQQKRIFIYYLKKSLFIFNKFHDLEKIVVLRATTQFRLQTTGFWIQFFNTFFSLHLVFHIFSAGILIDICMIHIIYYPFHLSWVIYLFNSFNFFLFFLYFHWLLTLAKKDVKIVI